MRRLLPDQVTPEPAWLRQLRSPEICSDHLRRQKVGQKFMPEQRTCTPANEAQVSERRPRRELSPRRRAKMAPRTAARGAARRLPGAKPSSTHRRDLRRTRRLLCQARDQDPRDGRERRPQRLGELSGGEAQAAELGDRLDTIISGAIGDPLTRTTHAARWSNGESRSSLRHG
jgi:hypothetical protein